MKRPTSRIPILPPHSSYPDSLCLHTLVELNQCDASLLERIGFVRKSLVGAVQEGGGTIVKTLFHEFSPWGVSGVVVITESHVTIHTWPEHRYAAVDIFSCSPKLDHEVIRQALAACFKSGRSRIREFRRGPNPSQSPQPNPAPRATPPPKRPSRVPRRVTPRRTPSQSE